MTGGACVVLSGTVYASGAEVQFGGSSCGSGGGGDAVATLQFVAWDLTLSGNNNFYFAYQRAAFAITDDIRTRRVEVGSAHYHAGTMTTRTPGRSGSDRRCHPAVTSPSTATHRRTSRSSSSGTCPTWTVGVPGESELAVEVVGPHLRLSGTIATGHFRRLSDFLNNHQGLIELHDATILRRNGDPTKVRTRSIWLSPTEVTLIGQSDVGGDDQTRSDLQRRQGIAGSDRRHAGPHPHRGRPCHARGRPVGLHRIGMIRSSCR